METKQEEALLGLATTKELLEELKARAEGFPHCLCEPILPVGIVAVFDILNMHFKNLPGGLDYRTVDS